MIYHFKKETMKNYCGIPEHETGCDCVNLQKGFKEGEKAGEALNELLKSDPKHIGMKLNFNKEAVKTLVELSKTVKFLEGGMSSSIRPKSMFCGGNVLFICSGQVAQSALEAMKDREEKKHSTFITKEFTPEEKQVIERIGTEFSDMCNKSSLTLEESIRVIEVLAKNKPNIFAKGEKRYGKGDRRKNKKNFNQQFRR